MDALRNLATNFVTSLTGFVQSLLSNSIFTFILGSVAGFYIWRHLENVHRWWEAFRERRHLKRANRVWEKYKNLASGLAVVQSGWQRREFSEDNVLIAVERAFQLPDDIVSRTRVPHQSEWEALHLEDNPQVGVFAIDAWRVSDNDLEKSHELRLAAQTYRYFDFLATHRLLLFGNPEEQAFLSEKVGEPDALTPVLGFPTPLSVGLSLFCEDGKYLVLTRRTNLASNGGLWWGNSIFNAVGENMSLEKDRVGDYLGTARVSPWKTAIRGLQEEIGLEDKDCSGLDVHLHSFVWDTRILDYKFFGYAVSPLSRTELEQRCWTHASDRHENRELFFVECRTRKQCVNIIRTIESHRSEWSSEAILCTILSLLHLKNIPWERLI